MTLVLFILCLFVVYCCADSELEELLPKGVGSVLIQPISQALKQMPGEIEKVAGFILVTSTITYAYSDKDRSWIRAVANKFRGDTITF